MGAKLQMRLVQPALVEHWSQRMRSLAKDVSRINEVSLLLQHPWLSMPLTGTSLEMHTQQEMRATHADNKKLA